MREVIIENPFQCVCFELIPAHFDHISIAFHRTTPITHTNFAFVHPPAIRLGSMARRRKTRRAGPGRGRKTTRLAEQNDQADDPAGRADGAIADAVPEATVVPEEDGAQVQHSPSGQDTPQTIGDEYDDDSEPCPEFCPGCYVRGLNPSRIL